MGSLLMVSIVVLAFSAVSLAVFSDEEAVDPPHMPHTSLQENIDIKKDTVRVLHTGGEAIDLNSLNIILRTGGQQAEFNMSDPAVEVLDAWGNMSNSSAFTLGDCIVIYPKNKINITEGDAISIYIVHTGSAQVIQDTVLWAEFGDLPYWITPHPDGSVSNTTGAGLDTGLVYEINDGYYTEEYSIKNEWVYENFTFGVDADDLSIPDDAIFTEVLLKIVYRIHDNSADLKLEIYNGSQWTLIDDSLPFYKTFTECDTDLEPYPITKYINTTELGDLKVKISNQGTAANESKKVYDVDFIGIHLEY